MITITHRIFQRKIKRFFIKNRGQPKIVRMANNRKGFALVEIMIALGLLLLTTLATTTLVVNGQKQQLTTAFVLNRNAIVGNLRLYIRTPAALKNTMNAAANSGLLACVTDSGGGSDCTGGSSQDLTLLPATGTAAVAGPSTAPVCYSIGGAICPCASAGPNCPLQAISSFGPSCPSAAAQCPVAQTIRVMFTVRQNPAVSTNTFGRLADQSDSYDVSAMTISSGTMSCNTGKAVTGMNADGSLVCEP